MRCRAGNGGGRGARPGCRVLPGDQPGARHRAALQGRHAVAHGVADPGGQTGAVGNRAVADRPLQPPGVGEGAGGEGAVGEHQEPVQLVAVHP